MQQKTHNNTTTKPMEKNKTAVEWVVKELEGHHVFHDIQNTNAFQIAKQMEKQQIVDAYGQGTADEAGEILDVTKDAEQYYNETYGK